MYLNLTSPKKKLTPNPDPAKLNAAECQLAADKWLLKALLTNDELSETIAVNKSAMYETMAHDGRK